MKPLLQKRTPAQLLWIIAASAALVAAGFGILTVQSWRYQAGQRHLVWLSLVLSITGFVGSLFAEQALKDGISNERWPEKLLDGPRKLSADRVFLFMAMAFILASIAYAVFSPVRHIGGMWMFLWPAMSLTRVSNYLRPKPGSANSSLLRTTDKSKPLQSEHWGTPPRFFSN